MPFFIHVPHSNIKQKVAEFVGENVTNEVSGELDIRPTVLHLFGIDTSNDIQFGTDLLSDEHDNLIVFRDGRFITEKYVYAGERCYTRTTGVEVETDRCAPLKQRAQEKLMMSDKVINGDLLRFYNNETGQMKK